MTTSRVLTLALLGVLVAEGLLLPLTQPSGETRKDSMSTQLFWARRPPGGNVPGPGALQKRTARVERLGHLSEDERQYMSKQIMQAISEMTSSDCMSERDYQGWVDFGRRSLEQR